MEALDQKSGAEVEPGPSAATDLDRARKRLQDRRDFGSHAFAYLVINAFVIAVWAVTGASYFWPAWVLAGWGVGLVMHGWDTFVRRPITEEDIDRELRSHRR